MDGGRGVALVPSTGCLITIMQKKHQWFLFMMEWIDHFCPLEVDMVSARDILCGQMKELLFVLDDYRPCNDAKWETGSWTLTKCSLHRLKTPFMSTKLWTNTWINWFLGKLMTAETRDRHITDIPKHTLTVFYLFSAYRAMLSFN